MKRDATREGSLAVAGEGTASTGHGDSRTMRSAHEPTIAATAGRREWAPTTIKSASSSAASFKTSAAVSPKLTASRTTHQWAGTLGAVPQREVLGQRAAAARSKASSPFSA